VIGPAPLIKGPPVTVGRLDPFRPAGRCRLQDSSSRRFCAAGNVLGPPSQVREGVRPGLTVQRFRAHHHSCSPHWDRFTVAAGVRPASHTVSLPEGSKPLRYPSNSVLKLSRTTRDRKEAAR
jgi:hypothetical protein